MGETGIMEIDSSLDVAPEETSKQMIEGLLAETRIPDSFLEEIHSWLKEFKTNVKGLKPFTIDPASHGKVLRNIFPKQIEFQSIGDELLWKKPASLTLIGSFAASCAVLRASHVDVLLEIPEDFLHHSDLLNHKYHVKRSLYLLGLAEKLRKKNYPELGLIFPSGNFIKPVVEIKLKDFKVRLHCAPPKDFFKQSRLLPDKNNLRFNNFYGSSILSEAESCSVATPHYNFSVAEDVHAKSNNELLQQGLTSKPVRESVMLLKIWLKQRSLLEGYGSFTGFLASMYMTYLLETNAVLPSMSTYQILKTAFHHLSTSSWDKEGISFSANEELVNQWHQHSDVVFSDSTGTQNFAAHLSKFTYMRIKGEAGEAFRNLQTGTVASFQAVFMKQIPFLSSFDHIIQILDTVAVEKELQARSELRWAVLNHSGNTYAVAVSLLGSIIEKCVGNRVELIDIQIPPVQHVKLFDVPAKCKQFELRFGLVIRREAAMKQVEKCESEEPEVVEEFKHFWGDLSQLRRFRDGSMAEAVVFTGNKQRVCYEMLKYAIDHHLGVNLSSSVTSYLDLQIYSLFEPQFIQKAPEFIYAENPKKRKRHSEKPEIVRMSADEITGTASSSFERLSKALRQLNGLPLSITSVQCISPVYRYSHPFPTPPQRFFLSGMLVQQNSQVKTAALLKIPNDGNYEKVPKLVEPLNVLVQLETTNKWPDDLRAVERLKCALLVNMGQGLRTQYGLTAQAGPQYLDVLLDGLIFRVRLFYQRELILLKEVKDADGVIKIKDSAESHDLEKEGIQLPRISSTLHSFQHQFEPFGKVCRLAKRWLASHLMLEPPFNFKTRWGSPGSSSAFTEESVELLVASLFLNHSPYPSPPNEAQTGFLRFLELLAHTDWKITPLIVNFNQGITPEEVFNIERDFAKRRQVFPALFIATPQDKQVSYWTRSVHKIILKRVALLADTAFRYLSSQLSSKFSTDEDLRSSLAKVFSSSRDHFDAIVWLNKNRNSKSYQNIHSHPVPQPQFRKYEKSVDEFIPVVDFDPARLYLEELRENFGHLAMFFHDTYGGNFIAVVWKPDVLQPKDFSVSNVKGRRLANKDDKLEVNVEGVLEAFEVLGSGIVGRVETRTENWKT